MDIRNTIRTISNAATIGAAAMTQFGGCITDDPATAALNDAVCKASWLPPKYALWAIIGFQAINLVAKATRPGGWIYGLFGADVVVVPSNKVGVGTVTASQVKAG